MTMSTSAESNLKQKHRIHPTHLRLKGLQPKTIEA
jgi:hypothetical protein